MLLERRTLCFSSFKSLESNRSSRPEVFCKKSVLKNFAKFTEKHFHILNKLSEYTFPTKKTLLHTLFLLVFKIVKSLQSLNIKGLDKKCLLDRKQNAFGL